MSKTNKINLAEKFAETKKNYGTKEKSNDRLLPRRIVKEQKAKTFGWTKMHDDKFFICKHFYAQKTMDYNVNLNVLLEKIMDYYIENNITPEELENFKKNFK